MDVLTGLRGGYILGVSDGYMLNLPLVGYAVGSSKHFPLPTPTMGDPHVQLPDVGEPTAGQLATYAPSLVSST